MKVVPSHIGCTGSSEHDDVAAGERCNTELFAQDAPQAIAIDGASRMFLADHETETRVRVTASSCEQAEGVTAKAEVWGSEHMIERGLVREPAFRPER